MTINAKCVYLYPSISHLDLSRFQLVFLYKLVEGIAPSSFGTHVANLAGVPMEVVKRAEVISTDFAKKFKERIEGKRTTTLPIYAQADFAYLTKLARGEIKLPDEPVKKREIMSVLRSAVGKYIQVN
jgi:DNA mismatch repair protein MSH6